MVFGKHCAEVGNAGMKRERPKIEQPRTRRLTIRVSDYAMRWMASAKDRADGG